MSEGIEAVKEVKKFVEDNKTNIVIARVPPKTKKLFLELRKI